LLATPPFPEYPSGHSVQSAAAATVLAELFGDTLTFMDYTHDARGLTPRIFHSFTAFAEEAALSRLYGGIHYRSAIERGLEQGRCIGGRVNALTFRVEV
jgi:membrane-associated phospholipid phosphatase